MSSNPALSQTIDSAALFGSIHHLAKVEKQISNCWTTRFKKYVCILSATPKFQPALYTLQVPFFFFLLFFFCLFSFLLFFPMKQSHNKTFFFLLFFQSWATWSSAWFKLKHCIDCILALISVWLKLLSPQYRKKRGTVGVRGLLQGSALKIRAGCRELMVRDRALPVNWGVLCWLNDFMPVFNSKAQGLLYG